MERLIHQSLMHYGVKLLGVTSQGLGTILTFVPSHLELTSLLLPPGVGQCCRLTPGGDLQRNGRYQGCTELRGADGGKSTPAYQ